MFCPFWGWFFFAFFFLPSIARSASLEDGFGLGASILFFLFLLSVWFSLHFPTVPGRACLLLRCLRPGGLRIPFWRQFVAYCVTSLGFASYLLFFFLG